MENLKERTFRFSNNKISFVELMPERKASSVVSFQLLKVPLLLEQIIEQRNEQEVTKSLYLKLILY